MAFQVNLTYKRHSKCSLISYFSLPGPLQFKIETLCVNNATRGLDD